MQQAVRARRLLTFSISGRRQEFATCVSYSDWELNPDFGRLSLKPPSGILDDSLSSDGLQKSDGNREREAKNSPFLGGSAGSEARISPGSTRDSTGKVSIRE